MKKEIKDKTKLHKCGCCDKCQIYIEGPMKGYCSYGGPYKGYIYEDGTTITSEEIRKSSM